MTQVALLLGACVVVVPARAWVYPEHRDIAVLAVTTLDAQRRQAFDRLWKDARVGSERRLCESGADTGQGVAPMCIDWAAMAAISGDHSCSSRDMLGIVLDSPWILGVADVAAQLKLDLDRVPVVPPADAQENKKEGLIEFPDFARRIQSEANRAQRLNALRTSDIRLQRADPAYATRAGANNAHFLLARPNVGTDAREYAQLTLQVGSELNAIGVYGWFHLSALQKASRLANENLTVDERRALARAILADEAFALHFLEDTFAAGHVAGTWGDTSQRKGTHDIYNANGLEVITWDRSGSLVIMGDAHMRPEDAANAAKAVRESIEQVLDTVAGRPPKDFEHYPRAPLEPDGLDVCNSITFPRRAVDQRATSAAFPAVAQVLAATPVPGLGAGLGSLPRFRSELGPFVGMAGSIEARSVDGGFVPGESGTGAILGLDLAVRAGVGLEGVIGDSGDGLVFASLGVHSDSPSTNKVTITAPTGIGGNLSAAIPARTGLSMRLRMPFYLVPGDLLLLSPMFFFDPDTYSSMAVTASNGGLIPWQLGWSTSIGRFQFVLGRELGVTFYGLGAVDSLIAPPAIPGDLARVVNYKSTLYDLPILEYRPYRSFASNQSSTILFQLFAGADVPYGYSVASPVGAPQLNLDTVWSIGLRMVFDWRYYY